MDIISLPKSLFIEPTHRCNLNCVMCHSRHTPELSLTGDISLFLRQHLVSRAKFFTHVGFIGRGEPMLYEPLTDFVYEMKKANPDAVCSIISNAQAIRSEKYAEELLDCGLTQFSFSLDAARNDTYSFIRGGKLSKALHGIAALTAARKRKKRHAQIGINVTVNRYNLEELPEVIELAKQLEVDSVFFGMLTVSEKTNWQHERDGKIFTYAEALPSRHPGLCKESLLAANARAKELGIPLTLSHRFSGILATYPLENDAILWDKWNVVSSYSPEVSREDLRGLFECRTEVSECREPWNNITVWSDGGVAVCCGVDMSAEPLGIINEDHSLEDVWYNNNLQSLRKSLNENKSHWYCKNARCTYRMPKPEGYPSPLFLKIFDDVVAKAEAGLKNAKPYSFRYGQGKSRHAGLSALFERSQPAAEKMLQAYAGLKPQFQVIPWDRAVASPEEPFWHEAGFPLLDCIALYGNTWLNKPGAHIEIGSGAGIPFVQRAAKDVGIVAACRVIPSLSTLTEEEFTQFSRMSPGDVVHFSSWDQALAPNSEAALFFLEVLPALPAGVTVCCNTIYLPDDLFEQHKTFSSQYALAALLLSGGKLDVTFPAWWVSTHSELGQEADMLLEHTERTYSVNGCSLWATVL